ncbi:MAG TPA: DUF1801 domain-containing protein [Patescibacteria group bacterium]|nr:DUF1801 domain-containing protein [Patescibacteria group bacterium]
MTPSEKIDNYIAGLTDWRGPLLAKLRQIFHEADPEVVEEWKWMGSPVWSHDGIIAVGIAFKTSVKLGFLYGASLSDPDNIFNDELAGSQRRAIKYYEGDKINEESLKTLIRSAVAHNQSRKTKKK